MRPTRQWDGSSPVSYTHLLGADLCFFTDHDHIIALESGGMSPQSFRAVEDLRSPAWTYSTDRTGSPLSGGIAFGSTGLEATVTAGATRAAHLALADSSATNRDLRATVADLQVAVTLTCLLYTSRCV